MDQEFIDIITRMVKEQGVAVLVDGLWKKWLADYTCGQYPKETARLQQILNANCGEYINSATDVPERKQALLVWLEDEEGLSPKAIAEYLDLLGLLLKGDTSKCVPRTTPSIPSPAAPIAVPAGKAIAASSQTPNAPVVIVLPAMVWIQGGTFIMGSPASERKENFRTEPQHQVTVSGFYMGKFLVTQKEYEELTGINPSFYKWRNLPVEQINWYDAVEYCNLRSLREGLNPAYTIYKDRMDPNYISLNSKFLDDSLKWQVEWNRNVNGYRLPTEAEWEYACRAGTNGPFSTGNDITTDQANYNGNYPYNNNTEKIYREKTTPVGSFAANPWGLYDMHGNVEEWCWDWYGAYPGEAQTDPLGASSGSRRVCRGGSWLAEATKVRSASRSYSTPDYRIRIQGFRLVRSEE